MKGSGYEIDNDSAPSPLRNIAKISRLRVRDCSSFRHFGFHGFIRSRDPCGRELPSSLCKSRRSHRERRCRASKPRGCRPSRRCRCASIHSCSPRRSTCSPGCQARSLGASRLVQVATRRGNCGRRCDWICNCGDCGGVGRIAASPGLLLVLHRSGPDPGFLGRLSAIAARFEIQRWWVCHDNDVAARQTARRSILGRCANPQHGLDSGRDVPYGIGLSLSRGSAGTSRHG